MVGAGDLFGYFMIISFIVSIAVPVNLIKYYSKKPNFNKKTAIGKGLINGSLLSFGITVIIAILAELVFGFGDVGITGFVAELAIIFINLVILVIGLIYYSIGQSTSST